MNLGLDFLVLVTRVRELLSTAEPSSTSDFEELTETRLKIEVVSRFEGFAQVFVTSARLLNESSETSSKAGLTSSENSSRYSTTISEFAETFSIFGSLHF